MATNTSIFFLKLYLCLRNAFILSKVTTLPLNFHKRTKLPLKYKPFRISYRNQDLKRCDNLKFCFSLLTHHFMSQFSFKLLKHFYFKNIFNLS